MLENVPLTVVDGHGTMAGAHVPDSQDVAVDMEEGSEVTLTP